MDHYQRIGYFDKFALYITGYPCQLTGGKTVTDTAYFQVRPMDVIKYWKLQGMNHLWLSDFLAGWSPEWGEEPAKAVSEDGSLSADTKRRLALVPLERMDGIVLRHGAKYIIQFI